VTTIIGIDPGLTGAIAILEPDGKLTVHDMPTVEVRRHRKLKREINSAVLAGILTGHQLARAFVERVGAMPGQGVSSVFAFGRSTGIVEGILAARLIPVTYVAPQTWRKDQAVRAGKDGSRLRASELLPGYAVEWRRAKDDGRAEAALIALWGLMRGSASHG
jgi:crossover junction endodeoxyribonuclease RuvC